MFSSSPFVFSLILIEIFHSAHAAKKIFTIGTSAPTSEDAFGEIFISQKERDEMIKLNPRENSILKSFTLKTPMKYFDNEGRKGNEQTIFVSHWTFWIQKEIVVPYLEEKTILNKWGTNSLSVKTSNFTSIINRRSEKIEFQIVCVPNFIKFSTPVKCSS